jgi:dihydroorotase
MNLLIRSAKIIDPNSPHNGKVMDILIEGGVITQIKKSINAKGIKKVIEHKDLRVSPGWFDMQAHFCDPGFEYKENIESGTKAAAKGGFTGVALSPATHPTVSSKSQVEYIVSKAAGNIVDVHPIGTISHKLEGKELSEMYDMKQSGAVAFSDDHTPVMNAGLMHRALMYSKSFGGLIISRCNDTTISSHSGVNEGEVSVRTGIKGEPSIAEEIMVTRDLFLAQHTEGRLHINSVSTAGSIALIKNARKRGIPVTASINAYSIALDDTALLEFDSNCKVNPPLRSKEDIKALKKALAEGIIDVICSDHRPEDEENKKLEFDLSTAGMIGLQTMYPIINMHSELTEEQIVEKIATRPREILGLNIPVVKENAKANLTIFSPGIQWVLDEKEIESLSKNTPFIGKKLKGKVLGIFNNGMYEAS